MPIRRCCRWDSVAPVCDGLQDDVKVAIHELIEAEDILFAVDVGISSGSCLWQGLTSYVALPRVEGSGLFRQGRVNMDGGVLNAHVVLAWDEANLLSHETLAPRMSAKTFAGLHKVSCELRTSLATTDESIAARQLLPDLHCSLCNYL